MKKCILLLFSFLFIATFSLSQTKLSQDRGGLTIWPEQYKGARTNMIDKWKPIQIRSDASSIFVDYMNGDNTVTGLEARGWVILNEDSGGTTNPFYQGIPVINNGAFDAYEGPDSGYVASNFNGANPDGVIDQWLISPEISVQAGDVLRFWHRSPDNNPFDDSIFVHYSTTAGTAPGDFDSTWGRYLVSENGWDQWEGSFNYTGNVRFAVQYYIFNGGPGNSYSNFIGLDFFEAGTPCPIDQATNPNPSGGAVDIPISGNTAQWINGSGVDSICVYFGEVGNLQVVYDGIPISSLSLAGSEPLNYRTQYGWQVVGKNESCQVPGPVWTFTTEMDPTVVCAFMDDFTNTINWTAVNLNDPCDWDYSTTPDIPGNWGPPDFPATADSFYAFASSDNCGGVMNVFFTGNFSVDASQYQTVWIEFDSDFEVFLAPDPPDNAAVDISIDGGLSWTRVFLREVDAAAEHAILDISDLARLQGDLRFRLYYYGDFSWHWALDNFAVYLKDSLAVGVEITVPDVYSLEQNYPNPFNPNTQINFSLAADSRVALKVFDILGQEVFTLINGNLSAGSHNIDFNGANLNSGVYFYRIYATEVDGATYTSVKKMILTK